ncbi:MAG: carbamoyltransferase [Parcubacteria group bacterium]|nr:carbamoyltransferase [Parcubacteria group bacterium]
MAKYILGISCYYHDASAALLKDGKVVAAAQEERFTRKKHDTSFPINAVKFCLANENISIDALSHIGFYEKPFLKLERVLFQHLQMFPRSLKTFLSSMPSWVNEKARIVRTVKKKLGWQKGMIFVPHHLAHAAGSFLLSPFNDAAILTVDGVGEWTTTAWGIGRNTDVELLKEIRFPHSLGLLYSTITAYLGFSVNNSEYKVMGLSAFGNSDQKANPYYEKLKRVIHVKTDGSYRLEMDYFIYHFADRMPAERLCRLLGGPVRKSSEEVTERHKDIASALQMILEEVMTKILNHLYLKIGLPNLVLAGGVALNSVYNGKILRQTPFKQVWIQSDPGDGGTAIGVAAYIWNVILGHERNYVFTNPYLGPGFSTLEVKTFLDQNKIIYRQFKNNHELLRETAELIFKNDVVGWFQGRMEWGPRALGARSILANPMNPDAQELLNTKVKHREKFRPFAPVVCADEALKYFDCDQPIPEITDYMLMVYPVKEKWRKFIPAVTHIDGSGRLQTARREQNPLYYDLIKEFGKLSGVPILINTSFNIRGEPIVCTPHDAYKCMMGTGIDYLVMDQFLIKREDNQRDTWDSEKYAKD